MAQLVRWRHGKGVEIAMYGSDAEALEAVGLSGACSSPRSCGPVDLGGTRFC
jgi:hypothetical protein